MRASLTVIDPHLQWLYDDTPAHVRTGTRVPVLFEWHGDLETLVRFGMRLSATSGGIISADMLLSKLPHVHDLGLESIELAQRAYPTLDVSRPDIKADKLQPVIGDDTGKSVIVGIVDSGIDYTHASFRKPDGKTRILYLWDQLLTLVKPRSGGSPRISSEALPGNIDQQYRWGVEFTEQAINAALASGQPLRTKDTPEAHGSHVMGIAAGNGAQKPGSPATTFVGVAAAADLIVVATDFSHGNFNQIRQGIEYILKRALQRGSPCVINLSLGMPLGARDGKSASEKAIDALLTSKGRAIVVAAGNDANKKKHVQGRIAQGASDTLTFLVDQKQFGEKVIVEVWYGLKSTAERFNVEISDPSNAKMVLAAPTGAAPTTTRGTLGRSIVSIESATNLPQTAKNRILIVIQRTSRLTRISPGTWSIKLSGAAAGADAQAGAYHAYLYAPGSPHVPATVFTSPAPQINAASTVCIPATATKVISAGSFITKPVADTHKLSDFSSQGPTLDGRQIPTLCAPGQTITSVRAANAAAGPKTAAFMAMKGTSMAAPHVAGVVAGMLQVKPALQPSDIANLLGTQADAPPAPAPNAWGAGRVNALSAVTAAKAIATS
jgi:subtilisin family serine protease